LSDGPQEMILARPVKWPFANEPEPPVDPAWHMVPCQCPAQVYVTSGEMEFSEETGIPIYCPTCLPK
jgi:hypothetical protein